MTQRSSNKSRQEIARKGNQSSTRRPSATRSETPRRGTQSHRNTRQNEDFEQAGQRRNLREEEEDFDVSNRGRYGHGRQATGQHGGFGNWIEEEDFEGKDEEDYGRLANQRFGRTNAGRQQTSQNEDQGSFFNWHEDEDEDFEENENRQQTGQFDRQSNFLNWGEDEDEDFDEDEDEDEDEGYHRQTNQRFERANSGRQQSGQGDRQQQRAQTGGRHQSRQTDRQQGFSNVGERNEGSYTIGRTSNRPNRQETTNKGKTRGSSTNQRSSSISRSEAGRKGAQARWGK
jgi:hypothetical protein